MRIATFLLLSFSVSGCALVFRGTKEHVKIETTPAGAEAKIDARELGQTPTELDIPRKGLSQITVTKAGFEDDIGIVRKHINAAWLTLDILTCVFTACVPLIVDAVSGGWTDVDRLYIVTLKPANKAPGATPPTPTPGTSARPSGPPPEMSESERKATARAAYLEGVRLQEQGVCPEALPRLEAAQKFFSAPTHLLHIAQCQAATGKLVESSETYETLVRLSLPKDAPEAFRDAQEDGKKELAAIKPRVPTLKIQVTPAPANLSSLVVKLNGTVFPNEVLGLARPVNPGRYKVTVWAAGYKEATSEVDVPEGAPRLADVKLAR